MKSNKITIKQSEGKLFLAGFLVLYFNNITLNNLKLFVKSTINLLKNLNFQLVCTIPINNNIYTSYFLLISKVGTLQPISQFHLWLLNTYTYTTWQYKQQCKIILYKLEIFTKYVFYYFKYIDNIIVFKF